MPKNKPIAKKVEFLPMVLVIWNDALIQIDAEGDLNDPKSVEAFGNLSLCRDIGILIRQNQKEVVLACSVTEGDNTFRHANTIPRKWIKQIIHLKPEVPCQPVPTQPTQAKPSAPQQRRSQ